MSVFDDIPAPVDNRTFLHAVFSDIDDDARSVATGFAASPNKAGGGWKSSIVNGVTPPNVTDHHNNYFSISSITAGNDGSFNRVAENFDACHVIVLDDIGENGKVSADSIDLAPSYEIQTSPDNSQYGYILDTPCRDLEKLNLIFEQLKARKMTDQMGVNPVRWVRLPVGVNTKAEVVELNGGPFASTLEVWNPKRRFSLEDIIDGLGLDVAEAPSSTGNLSGVNIGPPPFSRVDANEGIKTGAEFHDNIRDLAASYVAKGLDQLDIIEIIQNKVDKSEAVKDERYWSRYSDIPRAVNTAFKKGFAPEIIEIEEVTPDEIAASAWVKPDTDAEKTPDFVLNPPFSKLLDTAAYVSRCGILSSPLINIAGALAIAQGVTGRRYYSAQYDNSTNFYLVLEAGTADGKDSIKKAMDYLFSECDIKHRLGKGKYTSGSALESAMEAHPARVSIFDEIGDQIKHGLNDKGGHAVTFLRALKTAFSDSCGQMESTGRANYGLSATQAAETEKSVQHPTFGFVGMTTSAQLFDSLTSEMVDDGFLNRIVVINTMNDEKTVNHFIDKKVPAALIDHVRKVGERAVSMGGNLAEAASENAHIMPNKYLIPFSKSAMDLIEEIGTIHKKGSITHKYCTGALLENLKTPLTGRWREIAMRMATAISAFEMHDEIKRETLQWCWDLVSFYGDRFITLFDEKAQGSQYQKDRELFLNKIREYPRGLERTAMGRNRTFNKLDSRNRMAIITDLIGAGQVREVKEKSLTSNNLKTIYFATK